MIKLIVSDVDGTLVPDGSPDLDPEVFDIILKLREKGMQFVVASGRPWAKMCIRDRHEGASGDGHYKDAS